MVTMMGTTVGEEFVHQRMDRNLECKDCQLITASKKGWLYADTRRYRGREA